jgi:hypothetical protein
MGQRILTGKAQSLGAVKQALAHLLKRRAAVDDGVDLLVLGHLGPQMIADDCLRHFAEKFT